MQYAWDRSLATCIWEQHTLVDLHVRDSLPLVHSHEPAGTLASALLPAAAQIYDELAFVTAQRRKNSVQPGLAEVCLGEQEGRDDDLLISHSQHQPKDLMASLFSSPRQRSGPQYNVQTDTLIPSLPRSRSTLQHSCP